jgi:ketosteroid isomerase-like protein
MSQENVEVVRRPFTVSSSKRRRLEDRLSLRFPGVRTLLLRLLWRLPPRSRLRQAALHRGMRLGFEANNRGDFEIAYMDYDKKIELVSDPRLVGLGFDRVYRGRAERVRFQQRWVAEWGDFQFAPEELIDLGDGRVFVRGRIVGSGLSSGAGFDGDWGVLFTFSDGRVVREQFFFNRAESLEAVGLSEQDAHAES